MLTKLKVSGFKNLVDVDVSFGPFTCIAGANGTGKSNLFDAIRFLSALANNTLIDAALSVRSEGVENGDIRSLFHHVGDTYESTMSFEAEMIVPYEGTDDLEQQAKAKTTFLRYSLQLAYRTDENRPLLGSLEILHEQLEHIKIGDAAKHLRFPHNHNTWFKTAVRGRSTTRFISTEGTRIKLSQDGVQGRPRQYLAKQLPRTIVSTVNATENPTALLARREMQSWRLLQLEPSSLRKPDDFTTPPGLTIDGAHLASTLYFLARKERHADGPSNNGEHLQIYDQIATRLSELLEDVFSVRVDPDEKRQLLTVEVEDRNHTRYPARSLSDGTLRFLALAVLELDQTARGVLCFEEPENGIHPERIPAILRLLQDIAVDTEESVGDDNPLRQVIVNTHSPTVVMSVPEDSLLVAEAKETEKNGLRFRRAIFSCLDDTWRTELGTPSVAKGKLLTYLNPVPVEFSNQEAVSEERQNNNLNKSLRRRVIDRPDMQQLVFSYPL